MEINEVKKYLFKNKQMAQFDRYCASNLYYTIKLEDGVYEFPVAVTEPVIESKNMELGGDACVNKKIEIGIKLADDLGSTAFGKEIQANYLNRWIEKAIKTNTFIQVLYF